MAATAYAEDEMFQVVEIPEKGKGMKATRDIKKGEIILEEKPVLTWNNSKSFLQNLMGQILGMSEEKLAAVLELEDGGEPREMQTFDDDAEAKQAKRKIMRIIELNAISIECESENKNMNMSGLFLLASRINHSCSPNAVWGWMKHDKTKQWTQVRALRKVKKGEEITVSYKTLNGSKMERQKMMERYFSACLCSLCIMPEDEVVSNDKIRKEIQRLDAELQRVSDADDIGNVCRIEHGNWLVRRTQIGEEIMQLANKKLRLMKSIKDEMMKDIPMQMLECCYIAESFTDVTQEKKKKLMEMTNAAKEMCAKQGDYYLHRLISDFRWKSLQNKK